MAQCCCCESSHKVLQHKLVHCLSGALKKLFIRDTVINMVCSMMSWHIVKHNNVAKPMEEDVASRENLNFLNNIHK